MNLINKLLIFVFILLIFSCGEQKPKLLEDSAIMRMYNLNSIPKKEDYPDDDYIVIKEEHEVKIGKDMIEGYYAEETTTLVKKIFKNEDFHSVIKLSVSANEEIIDFSGKTITETGELFEADTKDIITQEGSSGGSIFHIDSKSKTFFLKEVDDNSIVEYSYTIRRKYPFLIDPWYIENSVPTLVNKFSVTVPISFTDFKLSYKAYNFTEGTKPKITSLSNSTTYTWVKKDIPRIEKEPLKPAYNDYAKFIKFAPHDWQNWNDYSDWYYNGKFKSQFQITDEVKKKTQELIQDKTTEYEKIKALYEYVQSMRYVFIALGDGAYVPSTPSEVLQREYGDCKDKSMILLALLESAGIEAHPVLVLTKHRGYMDPDFPSWNFNHVIVKAVDSEGKVYWLDGTAKNVSPKFLPWMDSGINVMVLNRDGTCVIEKTPEISYNENLSKTVIDIDILSAKKAVYTVNLEYYGNRGNSVRNSYEELTEKELLEVFNNHIINTFLSSEITEAALLNKDDIDKPMILRYKFETDSALEKIGNLYLLNHSPYKTIEEISDLNDDERTYPVVFQYLFMDETEININIKDSYLEFEAEPEDFEKKTDKIDFSNTYEKISDKNMKIVQTFSVKDYEFPVEEYPEIVKLFEKMQKISNEKVVLKKNL